MTDINVVYGDKNFKLKFVIKDADGDVENLIGSTCSLHIKRYGGSTLVFSTNNDITGYPGDPEDPNPEVGEIRFSMGTIIWEGIGDYEGEIEITYSDNSVVTVPDLVFHVLEELG